MQRQVQRTNTPPCKIADHSLDDVPSSAEMQVIADLMEEDRINFHERAVATILCKPSPHRRNINTSYQHMSGTKNPKRPLFYVTRGSIQPSYKSSQNSSTCNGYVSHADQQNVPKHVKIVVDVSMTIHVPSLPQCHMTPAILHRHARPSQV